ncbi:MAG TPA: PAS domain S-box protein [Flavisolibacter sp.]|nr:PAS domain S-box protein [Flavisolibacter sp.]
MLLDKKVTFFSLSPIQKLIDSLPGITCILDRKGSFRFINKEFRQISGYRAEDLRDKYFTDFVSPEKRDNVQKKMKERIAGTITNSFEIDLINKNGGITSLSWMFRLNKEEQLIYCSANDTLKITETEPLASRFEKKVKQERRNLSDILERIREGFIAVDEEDRVIYWNRQAEIISGKPRSEVLTRNIFKCYPQVLQSPLYNCHRKAREEQTPQQHEAYFPESEKWIEVIIYPSKEGLTAFFRDITKRKCMEEQLEMQKKAQQKMITAAVIKAQEKERANVGLELHDNVNQVLTTVKLYTELAISGVGGPELMQKSKALLQTCIDEIRSLSKQLSAPTLGSIRMKDSINELVEGIAATGKTSICLDTKGIKDLEVNTDIHLALYRILQEHLTNILKHADASFVKIHIDHMDDELILKVIDNGKGFKMNEKRAGIGISNMTSRVVSLGGRLTLNSAPGLGCVLIAQFSLAGEKCIEEE